MNPDDPRHGTPAGGRVHRDHHEKPCRPCADAEARYERGRQHDLLNGRPRALPAAGTQLRLQALVALGHGFTPMAAALGTSTENVRRLTYGPRAFVRSTTAARIAELYDAWSMTLPPSNTSEQRRTASYARTVARKRGWLPPLALDDDRIDTPGYRPTKHVPATDLEHADRDYDHAVVERVLAGDPKPRKLTHREAREVVRRLVARGLTTHDIERDYGLNTARYTHPTGAPAA